MGLLHFRRIERRRTTRATMCMTVEIQGKTDSGEFFKYGTKTVSVNGHGGVVSLLATLDVGQRIQLTNEFNDKKAEAKVVGVRTVRDGQVLASFEFVSGGEKFWSMAFPAPGARPLRRLVPRVASGS